MFRPGNKLCDQIIHPILTCSLDNIREPHFAADKSFRLLQHIPECFYNILFFILRREPPIDWKRFRSLSHEHLIRMILTAVAPESFLRMPYKQPFIIIVPHLFSIRLQFFLILLFPKDFCKDRESFRIRVEEYSLHILPGKIILRIAPVAQSVADKSFFCNLCLQITQIAHTCIIIVLYDLFVPIEDIMPVSSKDACTPPRDNIIKASHTRHRQHIWNITRTLGRHQAVPRIKFVPLIVEKTIICRMLCRPHIKQKLFPKLSSVFHIED